MILVRNRLTNFVLVGSLLAAALIFGANNATSKNNTLGSTAKPIQTSVGVASTTDRAADDNTVSAPHAASNSISSSSSTSVSISSSSTALTDSSNSSSDSGTTAAQQNSSTAAVGPSTTAPATVPAPSDPQPGTGYNGCQACNGTSWPKSPHMMCPMYACMAE